MTQKTAFTVRNVVVPIVILVIVGLSGFALGHTQLEGHPVMAERVNDGLVRIGRLEVKTEALEVLTHRLELEGIDDRFRGSDADDMEDRVQVQLDVIRKDLNYMKNELVKVKSELGLR